MYCGAWHLPEDSLPRGLILSLIEQQHQCQGMSCTAHVINASVRTDSRWNSPFVVLIPSSQVCLDFRREYVSENANLNMVGGEASTIPPTADFWLIR